HVGHRAAVGRDEVDPVTCPFNGARISPARHPEGTLVNGRWVEVKVSLVLDDVRVRLAPGEYGSGLAFLDHDSHGTGPYRESDTSAGPPLPPALIVGRDGRQASAARRCR